MERCTVIFQPDGIAVTVNSGTTLLQAQIAAGLQPDAPCGGRGTCGKCKVRLDGTQVLACETPVDRDMTVFTGAAVNSGILAGDSGKPIPADGTDSYALAFDIGTTTLVAYLLNGITGEQLATAGCMNPQRQFGADVISRIQHAKNTDSHILSTCVWDSMRQLTAQLARRAGISPEKITAAAIAGNTAMHHLLLGIDPQPLVTPPYMPSVSEALELPGACRVRVLPNIAGFVGGDTVACMVSTGFDRLEELTLLIDIGTNGEMVLGNKHRRIACSTAAGPAFEGARISCGMRGTDGAVDHVWLEKGRVCYHVIGGSPAAGLCGSGLLDLIAVLLELGIIGESGRMEDKSFTLCENVILTQKDVREVQLAKGAIRAGIELLAEAMGAEVSEIKHVFLAGAFGNYMDPASACRIGMIPPILQERIQPIGNGAGEGAKLCALSREAFLYSQTLAKTTDFLELASLHQFQDRYIDALMFSEEEP